MQAIMPSMARAVLPLLLVVLVAAAGCGGGDEGDGTATVPTQSTERRPTPPGVLPPSTRPGPLDAPKAIPRVGLEAADPADVRVLERWLRAIREGRTGSAARLFAPGAKVQNGTPVLTLRTPADRAAWTATLPCGARIASASAARGYLVVEYELTERAGADCGSGVGGSVRGAVKVEDGRIAEWYRLETPAPVDGDGRRVPA